MAILPFIGPFCPETCRLSLYWSRNQTQTFLQSIYKVGYYTYSENILRQLWYFPGLSCLDLFKNHVKKAREQRASKDKSAQMEFMFYPRKVSEKFEAHLPPEWISDGQRVAHVKPKCIPAFVVKFFADPKVRNRIFVSFSAAYK